MKPTQLLIGALCFALLIACSTAHHLAGPQDIRHQIAAAYGSRQFDRVEALTYTFNAVVGDKQVRRAWQWWPQTDKVRFTDAQGKSVTYRRSEIADAPQELRRIDAWFINDQYWLLFPLHLVWDENIRVTDGGMRPLPITDGQGRWVEIVYPTEGGYTPGDAYELFIDDGYRIVEWIYRKGGATTPTRVSTWEDYRRLGPLTLALDHYGETKDFRVWFTEVGVKSMDRRYWYRQ